MSQWGRFSLTPCRGYVCSGIILRIMVTKRGLHRGVPGYEKRAQCENRIVFLPIRLEVAHERRMPRKVNLHKRLFSTYTRKSSLWA